MADTFKIYKGTEVVAEGVSPLAITGIAPNTDVADGTYQAVRVVEDRESEKLNIPAFKTLPINVTSVTLDKTELSVDVGATATLTAAVAPSNATNKAVTWKSSDEAKATVDANGKVTAVSAGAVDITVTTTDGSKVATCKLKVTTPVVAVTGVTLNKTTLALAPTATEKLVATISPDNATNKAMTWKSSDEAVATIATDGTVTTVTDGETTITVTTTDGSKTATCVVTVATPAARK